MGGVVLLITLFLILCITYLCSAATNGVGGLCFSPRSHVLRGLVSVSGCRK